MVRTHRMPLNRRRGSHRGRPMCGFVGGSTLTIAQEHIPSPRRSKITGVGACSRTGTTVCRIRDAESKHGHARVSRPGRPGGPPSRQKSFGITSEIIVKFPEGHDPEVYLKGLIILGQPPGEEPVTQASPVSVAGVLAGLGAVILLKGRR